MRLNFKGSGFATKDGSLCQTCEHCHHRTGEKLDQSQAICTYSRDFLLTYDVKTCTMYNERGRMSLPKMYQEAWTLAEDKSGKIGFYSADEFKKREGRLTRVGKDFDPYEDI